MKKFIIFPSGFAAPRGTYSPRILLDYGDSKLLYATGQLAVDPDGTVIAPNDATAQTEYVFKLIGEILAAAGLTFDDIVRAQTYLTNIDDFPKFSVVRNRYLGTS